MKENSYDNNMSEQDEEKVDYRELLFRYIIHWPWFVASIMLCLIVAWVYLHFQTPVYQVSASIMIKDDKKSGGSTDLENLGIGGVITSTQSIDNEIEVLRSKTILKEVVNNLELYITYNDEDEFPKKEMYKTSPVIVNLTAQEADKLPDAALIDMKISPEGGLNVNLKVGLNEYNQHFDRLPAVLPTDAGTFGFALKDSLTNGKIEGQKGERHISAVVSQPFGVAKGYQGALNIAPTSKATSVAVVSLMNTNIQRAQDFINKLMEMYNRNTNNDKNEVAEKTREFINERIKIIDEELGSTEDKLEAFKRNAGLTDISSDAQLAVSGNAEYEKKRVENGTQINLVRDLTKYINNPSNEYEVLPGNIGLEDNGLTTQIERYNELVTERKRLLRTSTESNPMIVNLDTSIRAMKANVQAAINGTLQGLLIMKADLDREAGRFSRRISDAPGQERQYVSIARQQEIKAGLYLMLLQKREENAITLAATANNAKIIDEPVASGGPLSPKPKMIYMIALVVGVGLPVGIIFLIGLTKLKIEGRGDIEKLTRLPIVGDVPLTTDKTGSIAVFENQNTLMSETFRNIRTNLQFMLEKEQKVILVTSTISGEGKSFISANLAISLSLLGKKVVIVGLDIRKPGLNKVFNISRKEQGITQYLSDPEKNLMDFVQPSDISKSLYIIPGGTVPPNPTELLARDGLEKAVAILRKEFDYVILDTAPVGMVTDTLLIGRVADLSVYVCRADYTRKAEFTLVNEFASANKLPNLCTVINGLDLQKKKYGYYYGYGKYGKYYGYGKRYGYGYGYGENKVTGE
ncbi:GumC family protein [Bacteroides faecium]|uniref:non-specific protein-tyrosine kinase n=1 Tax=Bacteroides faecium TaxID=2715212 RepID=A0A6H0KQP4_9BACE|nr:polysaccharide biosynthesis tyrosine autokinase [Bacteroides faecium]QIU95503.1 polysaccharide biosynthesis tyrosine autokinase [Bacteroides faecium]